MQENIIEKNNEIMKNLAKKIDLKEFKSFIENNKNIDINYQGGYVLRYFCDTENEEGVKILLKIKNLDISYDDYIVVEDIFLDNNIIIFDILKSHKNFSINFKKFNSLKIIIRNKSLELFKKAIKTEENIDLSVDDNKLLFCAIRMNSNHIVDFLLNDENVIKNIKSIYKVLEHQKKQKIIEDYNLLENIEKKIKLIMNKINF